MENLKLPVALVAAMAVQLAAGVWWVGQQAATIASLEETVGEIGSKMAIEDNVNLKRAFRTTPWNWNMLLMRLKKFGMN